MTPAQLNSISIAKDKLFMAGKPEMVNKINWMLENDASYEDIWQYASSDLRMIKPERESDQIPHPPFTGKGSSTPNWQQYARDVTDMEEEVILALGRNDLITVLADRGIIALPPDE